MTFKFSYFFLSVNFNCWLPRWLPTIGNAVDCQTLIVPNRIIRIVWPNNTKKLTSMMSRKRHQRKMASSFLAMMLNCFLIIRRFLVPLFRHRSRCWEFLIENELVCDLWMYEEYFHNCIGEMNIIFKIK